MTTDTLIIQAGQAVLATRENAAQVLTAIRNLTATHLYRLRMDRPTIPPAQYEDALYSVTAEITHDLISNLVELVLFPEQDGCVTFGVQLQLDQLDGSSPGNLRPALEVEFAANMLTLNATERTDDEIQHHSYRLERAQ